MKMDHRERELGDKNWINPSQDRDQWRTHVTE
jgi:hypothetical protein